MQAPVIFMLVLVSMSCFITQNHTRLLNSDLESFGVSYGYVNIEDTDHYTTLILEPDLYTNQEIRNFKLRKKKVIAYLSIGEVVSSRSYFAELKEIGFLGENDIWKSSIINLMKSEAKELFLTTVIPQILSKGFDGLFLDTVDSASPYGNFPFLSSNMANLIKSIRDAHPEIIIIQNAGFFLLDESAIWVDAVAIESVATHYNFKKKEYYLPSDGDYNSRLAFLRNLKTQYSDLSFIIIDFAKGDSLVKKTKSRLDTLSTPYFIGEIELSSLPKHNISNN